MPAKSVESITAPDGTIWRIGEKVTLHSLGNEDDRDVEIASIFEGNGSWDREQPNGDHNAVWFTFTDGWAARPWLVSKKR